MAGFDSSTGACLLPLKKFDHSSLMLLFLRYRCYASTGKKEGEKVVQS